MDGWTFILAQSNDLTNIVELFDARDKTLSLTLNKPGTCSFTFPMSNEISDQIVPYSSAIKCYRDGILVWSGYVLSIDESASQDRMTVNAVGWLQRLDKRFLRQTKNYAYSAGVSTDDGTIVFDLLAEANLTTQPDGYSVIIPSGSSPSTPTWLTAGSKLPNEGSGGPTSYVSAYRGRTYDKYQNILSAINEMTELENGCEIHVDPATRQLNIYRKKMVDKQDVIFGYNWGPNNIQNFERQVDGSTQINYHVSTGVSTATPQYEDDPTNVSTIGLLEEQEALSDVSNTNVLLAYSAAEVVIRVNPKITYQLTPFPYSIGQSVEAPEPFVDYNIGDKVYLTAVHEPRISIQNQAVRVFGMTVNITNEGNEIISALSLAPGG